MRVLMLIVAIAILSGCSIEGSAKMSFFDKWNKHLTITKRTETTVPAEPTPSNEVDTQEVKVNPSEKGGEK